MDRSLANLQDAKRLRVAAKRIVERLLAIARERGYKILRGATYAVAVNSTEASSVRSSC
jgi:hypothetical protein